MFADPLSSALDVASSGLSAQSLRLRVVSENLANAQSTAETPGADPYRRKTITFAEELSKTRDAVKVRIKEIGEDTSPYRVQYDPGNPAADAAGYVKYPNVSFLKEIADMREATRSYEANVQVISQVRSLISMVIGLLEANG